MRLKRFVRVSITIAIIAAIVTVPFWWPWGMPRWPIKTKKANNAASYSAAMPEARELAT